MFRPIAGLEGISNLMLTWQMVFIMRLGQTEGRGFRIGKVTLLLLSDAQTLGHPDVQMFRCPDAQMPRCFN